MLLCNIILAACCAALFHGAGLGMVLLVTCNCALLGMDVLRHACWRPGRMIKNCCTYIVSYMILFLIVLFIAYCSVWMLHSLFPLAWGTILFQFCAGLNVLL